VGTHSPHAEAYLKKGKPWKHLIFVLNICDVVPTWATKWWVAVLSQVYPTLFSMHVLVGNIHSESVAVGKLCTDRFIGYPSAGKSTVMNTAFQESLHRGPHCSWNKGLVVCHLDVSDVPD
jgi:nuclear GTP-binding protein